MTEREVLGYLEKLRGAGSSLWVRNSLLYGLSRLSQVVAYLLVAVWFRTGSETDSFFLAYAVTMFILSAIAATASQVMIPYLKQEPGSSVLLLALGTGLLLLGGSLLVRSSLLLAMVPVAALGAGSALLSGRLNFRGIFWKPPVATLGGSVVSVLFAFPLHESFGLLGIGLALSAGEGVRFLLLLPRSLLARPTFPVADFFRLLSICALLGVTPLAIRFVLDYGSPPGGVTIFSYAWGLMGVLLSFTTIGLTVTGGSRWKDFSQVDLAAAYRRLLPYIVSLSALLMVCTLLVSLLALAFVPALAPVLWLLFIFVSGLSLYILASAALAPMVILGKLFPLARAAVLGNLVAIGGSWSVVGSQVSVVGSASAMVLGTGLLAALMVRSFSR